MVDNFSRIPYNLPMRNNQYLLNRLQSIWQSYFSDCCMGNNIYIHFGRKAEKRLGSIRKIRYANTNRFDTLITINGYFRDKKIPDYVIDATIAHELCHYIHGISSPLPRLCLYPHRGGVIEKEFVKRGIDKLEKLENNWLNQNWEHICTKVRS